MVSLIATTLHLRRNIVCSIVFKGMLFLCYSGFEQSITCELSDSLCVSQIPVSTDKMTNIFLVMTLFFAVAYSQLCNGE